MLCFAFLKTGQALLPDCQQWIPEAVGVDLSSHLLYSALAGIVLIVERLNERFGAGGVAQ